MTRQTFKKNERLTSKRTFELLFNPRSPDWSGLREGEPGKSFTVPPFRLVWLNLSSKPSLQGKGDRRLSSTPVQLGISVPKKSFAKAVDRNTIKRRIRESYRKNKHLFYEILKKKNLSIALMIIYIAKEALPYGEIEKKMIVSLRMLGDRV